MDKEETDRIQTRLVMFLVAVTKYLMKLLKGRRICFGFWFQKAAIHFSAEGMMGAVPLRQKPMADSLPVEADQKERANWR